MHALSEAMRHEVLGPLEVFAVWLYVFACLLFFATASWAAEPMRCQWATCEVVDHGAAACSNSGRGTPAEMLEAEVKDRGRGRMFMRECSTSGFDVEYPPSGVMPRKVRR